MKKNSKESFIKELSDALSGSVPSDKYYEVIHYYEGYFSDEAKKGKSEEQICASLGSPRLIAKSIIESQADAAGGERIYDTPNMGESWRDREDVPKGWHINMDETGKTSLAFGKLDFGSVAGKIVIAILLVLLACVILGIIYIGAKIFLYFIVPVALILLLINVIISFIGRK